MLVNKDRFYIFVGALLALLVFGVNTYPIFEGDLFWHMKTGQWILQNSALPVRDPFNYTTYLLGGAQDPARVEYVLSSYWLGQVMLYLFWKLGGSTLIVLLRAATYAGIILALFVWIGKSSRGILAVAGLLAVATELYSFPGERPQLFGYVLFLVMLVILEKSRVDQRASAGAWLLPIIMCVWANIHGSFLLGDAVILLYAMAYVARSFRNFDLKSGYLPLLLVSVAASAINPNHLLALGEFFKHYQLGFTASISEYASPLKKYGSHLGFLVLVPPLLLLLAVRGKKMALEHLGILLFLGSIALYNVRYVPFFLFSLPVAYLYLGGVAESWLKRLVVLLLVFVWGITRSWDSAFAFGIDPMYPESSVKFLNEAAPSGPLLNFVNWGGYIMFFSKYPVFCDGRYLAPKARGFHDDMLKQVYGIRLLDRFNISTVLIPGTNPYANDATHGQPLQLLIQMAQDDRWVFVHYDEAAVVFVRDIPENAQVIKKYRLPKEQIAKHIELRRQRLVPRGL